MNADVTLLPSLASFAIYWNSEHSHLYYSNKSVTSQIGDQTGDPLCPLLFSLTLCPAIEEIETKIPNLTQPCWYLNGGIIAGTETELNETVDILIISGKLATWNPEEASVRSGQKEL